MAIACFVARVKRAPFADLPIAEHLDQAAREQLLKWRDRLLPPLVTLKLFLLQIMHGNTSITHLRQLSGISFSPASYCQARARLPLAVLTSLLTSLAQWAHQACATTTDGVRLMGRRILIVDCSNFSMGDNAVLNRHFHRPPGAKPGIGYPMATVMGLLDAATGLFMQMLCTPLLMHDMKMVSHVHDALENGDILLGDRAYCTYAHFALLNARGVLACFRLHQRRKNQGDHGMTRWLRPLTAPKWMSPEQFLTLPPWLDVRLVSFAIAQKGFRTRCITIATTLLDEDAWPDAEVEKLYLQRWRIEGCFNHLKTTMRMNVLKCKSVEGVMKELAMYLLAYNLVRLAMLREAEAREVSVQRVSFIDTMRWLACRLLGLPGVERLVINPDRPGRWNPRVVRRRPKEYALMTRPREELKYAVETGV